jgi:hypothetical protein
MTTFLRKIWSQLFCRHHAYLEDLHRVDGEMVTAQCYKCGRIFVGSYGLGFPVQWERRSTPSDGNE